MADAAAGRPEGGSGGARLTVAVRTDGATRIVAPVGEIDHDTADALRTALAETPAPGTARILLDFTEVAFCDSTGLNLLLRARRTAEEAGLVLEVAALRPAVARLFDITGADTVLPVHPDLTTALAHRAPPADPPADPPTADSWTADPSTRDAAP